MKHTNFNMPTLRRITLFAILLLGTMPMWGTVTLYARIAGGENLDSPVTETFWGDGQSGTFTKLDCGDFWWKIEVTNLSYCSHVCIQVKFANGWYSGYPKFSPVTDGDVKYIKFETKTGGQGAFTDNQEALYNSECGGDSCANCEYLGEE